METNGLLEELDTVHCLVIRDLETGSVLSCTDASPNHTSICEGLTVLEGAERVYGHNLLDFDLPALRKVYPEVTLRAQVFDTLVLCRTRFAHIKETDYNRARAQLLPSQLIGSQSLEAWGRRIGINKGDFGKTTDWKEWTPEMQEYCELDVSVNAELVFYLRKAGALTGDIIQLEHDVAEYLAQQKRNGWPFDFEAAVRLQGTLAAKREEVGQRLRAHFGSWEEPGKLFTPKRDNASLGYKAGVPVRKTRKIDFNPASRDHIANRLQTLYGWTPTEFTPSGKPMVDETTLKGLGDSVPVAGDLVEYLTLSKRLGQLAEGKQAWLLHLERREEGGAKTGKEHIHHNAANVTITHRHRHSHPNVAQVPATGVPYGHECRALWTVPDGWSLLGADASGLELRCLAHYMARYDEGEYGQVILEGDIHTLNAEILKIARPQAKVFIYAYLYGAGDVKLGSIVEPLAGEDRQRAIGNALRKTFEAQLPALGTLVKGVKKKAKSAQYVNLIDGRRAYVRSPHSALNTLLQGTGAIICKKWIQLFSKELQMSFGPQGWDGAWAALGWIHDEVQLAVLPNHNEDAGEILIAAIKQAGLDLGFRLPLDGEYKIGRTWAETH